MTMNRTWVIVMFLAIGAGAVTRAQAPVGASAIEQLVALALAESPALHAVRAEVAMAEGERRQAGLRPNPIVAIDRREQFGGIESQSAVGVTLPLDLFRRDPRIAVAESATRAAHLRVEEAVVDRAMRVRMEAARLLAARRQLEVVGRLAEAAKSRVDLLAARVEAGAGRPLDRDLADVEWQRAEADRVWWQAEVDAATATLRASVGVAAGAPLSIETSLETEVAAFGPSGSPAASDASARPDVRIAAEAVAAATAERERARSEGRWNLSVTGAYMTRVVGMPSGRDRMHEAMVGVMVDLPWRNRQQGAIAAADAARRAAEATLADRQLTAAAEQATAQSRAQAALAIVRRYQSGWLATAERNLAVVREAWTLGDATLFDVLDEERRYLMTQTEYTTALRDAIEMHAATRRAMGVR